MTYRIDVQNRDGRAFIERMFNRVQKPSEFMIIGVAISGERALARSADSNNDWLNLVDNLLEASHTVKTNVGDWRDSTEGGLLCLVDVSIGLRFEAEFLELAKILGEDSEEAILTISLRGDRFDARLLWQDESLTQVQYWEGGK